MELVGKLLGNRYEILENVGNGGMATVYKAKDKILNRKVAIKVLKDEFANDQEFIKRFQIEAQSAASLSHPNIVSIYDVANEGNIHYIVMELIEGQTLKDVIKNEGKIDWRRSAEIASQIASGLSVAHKNHIIHRDIKPHNIIITKEGIAKITDFGIAKATSSSTINANANSLGSVHYFSPEHARGGYTDEKSDLYSLGVVLYEMVTGKLPFDGDNAVTVAMKHLKETPVPPKELAPDIPEGLNSIIKKAMQKEVSERYNSASAIYTDLQRVLKIPNTLLVGEYAEEPRFNTQKIPSVDETMYTRQTPIFNTRNINNKNTKENYGGKMDNSNAKKKVKRKQSNPVAVALVRFLLLLLIFAVAVGAGFLVFNALMGGGANNEKVVPNVVGDSQTTAQQRLEAAGFKMEIDGEMESTLPKDYIAWQRYASGDKLSYGTTINVKISSGPKKVLVPSVSGDSVYAAEIKLKSANLLIEVEEEESETVEIDKIVRQSPEANTEIDEGSVITVFVSIGAPTHVPDVREMTEAQAVEVLTSIDLVPDIHYVNLDIYPNGKIITQTLEPDTIVQSGDVIMLVINNYDWTGNNEEELEIIDDPLIIPTEPIINNPTKPEKQDPTPATDPTPVTPQPPVNQEPVNQEPAGVKELTLDLKGKGKKDTFNVKVVINGDIKGRTTIYEGTHSRSEGTITITYPADATGLLRVLIDDKVDSEMVL